jgi:hypothetical protein
MLHDPLTSFSRDAQNAQNMPDPVRSPVGLAYPRWPLLSALFVDSIVGIACLIWRFVPCAPGFLHFACGVGAWPNWLIMLLLWGLFLIGWLLVFIFGYGTIEVSQHREEGVSGWLRAISTFEPVRHLLYLYAALAFIGVIALAWLNQFQFIPFAMATIVIFVALWIAFRQWRQQQQYRQPISDEELLRRSIGGSTHPLYVFRSLPVIRGLWPPHPPARSGGTLGTQQPLDSV